MPSSITKRLLQRLTSLGVCVLLTITFVACQSSALDTIEPTQTATKLPEPFINTTSVPDPARVVIQFLEAWKSSSYEDMYTLLSNSSKESISEDQFIEKYRSFANELTLIELAYEITSQNTTPGDAKVGYQTEFQTALFSDFLRQYDMNLQMEAGNWRVDWDDSLIMPELGGGNYLKLDPDIPARESIYDRNENLLAYQTDAYAIGVYPDYVNLEDAKGLLSLLSRASGLRAETIASKIANATLGEYLPIAELASDAAPRLIDALSGYGYVVTSAYNSRFYPDGGVAPHVVGYVSAIQEDELDAYRRQGYQSYEKIGRDGIEQWGQDDLAGERGGTLYLFDPQGKPISQMGQAIAQPGQSIYTTIDKEFQDRVQDAIEGFRGAIVVMERDTGRVLAMASSPRYNPNAFQTENANWSAWLEDYFSDPNLPLFNRASQGQYPLGSVFKIITMAAALETGVFTPESEYECGYVFDEVAGLPRYDWTYERFLRDGVTQPSGLLTLPQGLIRSCNPYFWHIGLSLYNQGYPTAISDMARGFGLGSKTGIEGVEEEAGNIPDPQNQVDAINIAIGQGDVQVTPLQVANFIAAIGNGGTLYTPQLIERIVDQSGAIVREFKPVVGGELPISPENLQVIQNAMAGVVASRDPLGTAYQVFAGYRIPISGKTGTATAAAGDPHAWFAGYTTAEREDKPDIAIAVIAENVGEGSEWAAPILRRVVELYFQGSPGRLYPWEAAVGVTKTPTPLYTDTPTPEPEP